MEAVCCCWRMRGGKTGGTFAHQASKSLLFPQLACFRIGFDCFSGLAFCHLCRHPFFGAHADASLHMPYIHTPVVVIYCHLPLSRGKQGPSQSKLILPRALLPLPRAHCPPSQPCLPMPAPPARSPTMLPQRNHSSQAGPCPAVIAPSAPAV